MSKQSVNQDTPLKTRNVAAYGSGDIFGGGATVLIGLYFFFFLTENVGLSPLIAGSIFALGKLIDAVSDPFMGYFSDITRSRFGRRRLYFLIGILPIGVSFLLLWLPVHTNSTALLFIYYCSVYILFSLVYTLVMVPYSALNAELSRSESGRMQLAGGRMFFTQGVTFIAIIVPNWLLDAMNIQGYYVMGIVFSVIFCIPWIFVFLGTWELPYKHRGTRIFFGSYLKQFFYIVKNRTARCHIIMHGASYAAIDTMMVLALFFFIYYLAVPQSLYHYALGALMLTMICTLPILYKASKNFSPKLIYCVSLTIWAVGLLLGYILLKPGSHWGLVIAVCAFLGIGTSGGMLIPWTIFPSVIDLDEYVSGENRAGMYAGVLTFIRKAVQGLLVMPLTGLALHFIGYVPQSSAQSAQTLNGLHNLFFLAPAACIVIGLTAGIRLPLTGTRAALLKKLLGRKRNNGAPATNPDELNETELKFLV